MRQMKDSGIEWIGQIPEEWEVRRTKFLFAERNERCNSETELPLLSVSEYYGVAQRKDKIKEDETLVRAETLDGYKICYKHDIVSNIMLAWRSSLGESPCDGIVSPAYCVYRPITNICTRFYHHLFRTTIYANVFKQHSTGIIDSRLRLYSDKFFSLFVQVPPLDEQQRIADYLDAQCARIDETMELVRQSKEKLRAYKLSLITEAVTKGLDPDVPMKDSGIPWIGEIPAGWEVRRLKTISDSIVVGIVINPSQYVEEEGLPYIYGGDIQEGKINTTTCRKISKENSLKNKKTILFHDDILTVRVGYPGISSVVPKECEGGNCASVILTRKGNFNSLWYCYCLNSQVIKSQIDIVKYGAAQEQFNLSHMIEFSVPVPPLPEQQSIAAYLDEKCARIDTLLAEKDELLDKLAEYKKSLIFECVTGKREVAA